MRPIALADLLLPAIGLTLGLGLAACGDKGDEDEDEDDGDDTGAEEAVDADGDGFDASIDCNDDDPAVNPDAAEICDGLDNDCDELVDDADDDVDTTTGSTFYVDSDGDGYGSVDGTMAACELPAGYAPSSDDCDDTNAAVNPGATEVCDDADVDEDCSGAADDADPGVDPTTQTETWPDADGDGFGDASFTGIFYCEVPSGVVTDNSDCDDSNPDVNPDATEVCDEFATDEDCSGVSDDADAGVDISTMTETWPDNDGDGYGDGTATSELYCMLPAGTADNDTDCDDDDVTINPGAAEVCDEVDNDCDGTVDDGACSTCDQLAVLTYYQSFGSTEVPSDLAAADVGASSTATSSGSTFGTEYDASTWDVIVIDAPGTSLPTDVTSRITTQISSGGVVLFSWWDLDSDASVASTLGVTVTSSFSTPMQFEGTSGATLWNIAETLPSAIANNSDDAGDNGDIVTADDPTTSEQLAYFDGDTTQNAITATNNGQVIVNGFLPWDFQDTDDNANGTSDMVELYINEFAWTTGCTP